MKDTTVYRFKYGYYLVPSQQFEFVGTEEEWDAFNSKHDNVYHVWDKKHKEAPVDHYIKGRPVG